MRLTESLVLYGLVGLSCGIYQLRARAEGLVQQGLLLVLSVLFWPLLVPMLISKESEGSDISAEEKPPKPGPYREKIAHSIAQVDAAIGDAEGATGQLLRKEIKALDVIKRQLHWLDGRLLELMQLMEDPTFSEEAIVEELAQAEASGAGAMALESLAIKLNNARQMSAIKAEYTQRMEDSLALLGRIHSQITLLRFASHEPSQLAASAEQLLTLLDSLQEASSL